MTLPFSGWPGSGWLSQRLKLDGGSPATAQPVLDLRQRWMNSTATFTGLRFVVFDDGASISSELFTLQTRVAANTNGPGSIENYLRCLRGTRNSATLAGIDLRPSNSHMLIDVAGIHQISLSPGNNAVTIDSSQSFGFGDAGGNGTALWYTDAANIFAQRNVTNAQTYRLYNTYTSGTSFERLNFAWTSNIAQIGTEKGSGGGSARSLEFQTDATTRAQIDATVGTWRTTRIAAAVDATATITVAQIQGGIITSTTAAAVVATLPTGTLTDGGFTANSNNLTFEWSVINTGSNSFTVAAGTAHTIVGSAVVAAGTSGRFGTSRTSANTYVTYRLS